MKTIFHKLNEAQIPYAVVTAYIKCKGITTHHGKDIFVIGSVRDSGYLRSCGFTQTPKGHDSVLEYTLSNVETEDFKQRITNREFRVVQDDEDGMIYEPPIPSTTLLRIAEVSAKANLDLSPKPCPAMATNRVANPKKPRCRRNY